jgi:hypothetical protein
VGQISGVWLPLLALRPLLGLRSVGLPEGHHLQLGLLAGAGPQPLRSIRFSETGIEWYNCLDAQCGGDILVEIEMAACVRGSHRGAAIAVFVIYWPFASTSGERQLCSEAVNTVLTTKDLLEFERAKIPVEQLCGCRLWP